MCEDCTGSALIQYATRGVIVKSYLLIGCAIGAVSCVTPALGGDASAGKTFFQQQCSACHSAEAADGGSGRGPSLIGIIDRPAASDAQFSYSPALRAAHLTWNAATLTRFLRSPSTLVPGTTMLIAVPGEADRDNLIAYFQSVASARLQPEAVQPIVPDNSQRTANWRLDAPGRQHRITLASLPAPFATHSSSNGPHRVRKPENAVLALPPGFHADQFAAGLLGPRKMLEAPNGDIFVTEMSGGRVSLLHPATDGSHAQSSSVYLQGLKQPFGLAFYPNALQPRWLYVAETNRIMRYEYRVGDEKPRGEGEVVIPQLPSGGAHGTRDLAFSTDGNKLFVSVGSASNVAEAMSKKTPEQIRSWESEEGLGAAWDQETHRAAVLVFDAAQPSAAVIYASGIRNCVSLTVQPETGSLWCTTNERDALGDDLVPDYSTRVQRGGFYGWPWYYLGSNQDPRLKGERPDLSGKVLVPDILYQAHSAALSMTFYGAGGGKSAFPAEYVGDAFVAFHGSWNRSVRTGYKLVRVRMNHGEPTGEYQDFLTGFIVDDDNVWARPVATVQLKDGSLLMSEDSGNLIFRIWYAP
jgi:glucose/arabinose dehydrogenase/cytochrome c2